MVVLNKAVDYDIVDETCRRKVLAHSGSMMMVEVTFDKGGVGAVHTHPHEQITYVAKGKFEFEIDGVKTVVGTGDSLYMKPDVPHGTLALEDGILVDIFSPQRLDFLKRD